MGDRADNHPMGVDYQRGRGLVVSISIARADPPFHRPGVALRRRDLSALRARAFNRLTRATYGPEAAAWVQTLDQAQWENVLAGMRLLPWVVYAALWLVADWLARRAEGDDIEGSVDGLVHGAGTAGAAATGKALADWLGPHR